MKHSVFLVNWLKFPVQIQINAATLSQKQCLIFVLFQKYLYFSVLSSEFLSHYVFDLVQLMSKFSI